MVNKRHSDAHNKTWAANYGPYYLDKGKSRDGVIMKKVHNYTSLAYLQR